MPEYYNVVYGSPTISSSTTYSVHSYIPNTEENMQLGVCLKLMLEDKYKDKVFSVMVTDR